MRKKRRRILWTAAVLLVVLVGRILWVNLHAAAFPQKVFSLG